jgi:RimJ/RimL family protein N-acetyltransferase
MRKILKFQKMNEKAFQEFLESTIADSANALTSLGIDEEKAYDLAKDRVQNSLPQGINTHNHFIHSIKINDIKIGDIWYFIIGDDKTSFLANLRIYREHQNKGFGTESMILYESEIKNLKLIQIKLHVFKTNKKAKKFYEKLGYAITEEEESGYLMVKIL